MGRSESLFESTLKNLKKGHITLTHPSSISQQLATGISIRSVVMCVNCFRAEICEKQALSPIDRPDTEVVSLLPRPNSPTLPFWHGRAIANVGLWSRVHEIQIGVGMWDVFVIGVRMWDAKSGMFSEAFGI